MKLHWPPEFDAVKFEKEMLLARVKNTDIWLELDPSDPFWGECILSDQKLASMLPLLKKA